MRVLPSRSLRCRALAAMAMVAAVAAASAPPVGAATGGTGGIILASDGTITAFGHLTIDDAGAPTWPGFAIARSVAVLADGSGGWTLDGDGGIHPWGAATAVSAPQYSSDAAARAPTYWPGWDIARALVVLPDGLSGYVLDGYGGVHAFGRNAPLFSGLPYWSGWDIARGLDVHVDGGGTADGLAVLDAYGGVHAVGSYPSTVTAPYHRGRAAYQALHTDGGSAYTVGAYGIVNAAGSALTPDWAGYSDAGNTLRIRDIRLLGTGASAQSQPASAMARYAWNALVQTNRGGVTLDGFGGVHPFGSASVDTTGAPTWNGFDIARSLAVVQDGSGGWTLDGYGGVHAWGSAPTITAPSYTGADARARAPAYWPNFDIARALVVLPDGVSGYVLDGYGGLHAFGPDAPQLSGAPYWSGWDIARGLSIVTNPSGVATGGVVMDAYGGMHAFGNAVAPAGVPYWLGRDIARQLHTTPDGATYAVFAWGRVVAAAGSAFAPYWNGYSDWGSWAILRDLALIGDADSGPGGAQPMSPAAWNAYLTATWTHGIPGPTAAQSMPLDCEAAALQEALALRGVDVSQAAVFDDMADDARAPVINSLGVVAQWGDPYTNFVGNVYGDEGSLTGYGVYVPVVATVAHDFGGVPSVITDGNITHILDAVGEGSPVVIWTSNTFEAVQMRAWTGWDGRQVPYALTEHAVTVVAVDWAAQSITIDDVAVGRDKTFSLAQFEDFWNGFGSMAVVVS